MVVAVDPKRGIPYVLRVERDLPESEQTVFYVLPMREDEAQSLDEFQSLELPSNEHIKDIALAGLVNWKNLRFPGGGTVEFSKENAREHLELDWLLEIGCMRLMKRQLDVDEEKNSSSPSEEPVGTTETPATVTATSAESAESESESAGS